MNKFTIEDFDKMVGRYDVGIDPIGIDGKDDCAGYVLRDKHGKIMAVVDAKEFDNACKKFAKYYEEGNI